MARIDDLLRDYRKKLMARDKSLQDEYTRRWLGVEDRLRGQIDALALELQSLKASGESTPDWKLMQMGRYQELLAQAQAEVNRFNSYSAGLIEREQYLAWADGLDYSRESVEALWKQAGMEVRSFPVLDIERVRTMIGMTADGSPLAQLLGKAYPQSMALINQTLVDAIALGWNPKKTARMLREAMSWNLQHAFMVSRTEQMRAHRLATVHQYRNSGVVEKYQRRAALSGRTCAACLLEDGRIYEMQHQFSDHPAGRCTSVPILVDLGEMEMQSGRDYFLSLDPSAQKEMLGAGRYQAWKDGQITLDQITRMHNHPVWGEAPQLVALKELINE